MTRFILTGLAGAIFVNLFGLPVPYSLFAPNLQVTEFIEENRR